MGDSQMFTRDVCDPVGRHAVVFAKCNDTHPVKERTNKASHRSPPHGLLYWSHSLWRTSVNANVRGTSAGTDRNRSRGTAMLESNVSLSIVAAQLSNAGSLLRRNVCGGNAIAVDSMLSGRRGSRENDRSFHEPCDRPKGSVAALGLIQLPFLALGHRGR